MFRLKYWFASLLFFCSLFTIYVSPVSAGEAVDIMRKVRAGWEAADEESIVTAVTTTRDGRAGLTQQFRLWQSWKATGQDLARIKFTAPRHMEGIQLLTEGERQWFRSPPFKARPVRFDKGEGGTEFAQTVFTHEDLRALDLQTYQYSGAGTTLTAVPVKLLESAYSRLELSVDRNKAVITEIRYFNKSGEHMKTLTNGNWQETGVGAWRPRSITMINLQTGRKTEVTVSYVAFKRLPGKVFSSAELER